MARPAHDLAAVHARRFGARRADAAQARRIRACYGAKLTMIDAWLGKLLAAIERGGFYDDTMVIVCTDHGHYLGEKDIWGNPRCRFTNRSGIRRC